MAISATRRLPTDDDPLFLTEAGIETTLQYKLGWELRHFCLFELLKDDRFVEDLTAYHRGLIEVALEAGVGHLLDGVHYRASPDWGALLGMSPQELEDLTLKGLDLYASLSREYATEDSPIPVGCCIGPRGDAYDARLVMGPEEAEDYHSVQIATAKKAGVDFISALTFNHVDEAIGVTRAATAAGIPIIVSFSLNAAARLKTGPTLGEAIAAVEAATNGAPYFYMINCNHPVDFEPALDEPGDWIRRLKGIRPNASSLDHGILCQLGHLEEGDPVELGQQIGDVVRRFPQINVTGGCCGTDAPHLREVAKNVLAVKSAA
ncbi:MAG: homocysteine S-methyltransferase family protein [Rhodobacteraceae bacterium]|nr:homocysteine S-methyltransferase family protein [Paracoccaceae bacterium]